MTFHKVEMQSADKRVFECKKSMLFDSYQNEQLPRLVEYLSQVWQREAKTRLEKPVSPKDISTLDSLIREPLPSKSQPLDEILGQVDNWVIPNAVNTSHPLFLAYVTPPSLDICVIGDAIAGILNQNVSFKELSPIGTELENKVVKWLGKIIGYGSASGGVITSGGSMANLYGLLVGRRQILGESVVREGNSIAKNELRIYCSEHIHRSVHKAAIATGLGTENVCSIPADRNHQIDVEQLERRIHEDTQSNKFRPIAIVGAAGTRECGAFDDLGRLAKIAHHYRIWFHVDAAYGGFLKLAKNHPSQADNIHLADSITLDPHKLLFVPFAAGSLLVKNRQHLLDTFGVEGEYLERIHPPGVDLADFGLELARPMAALKIWLALKYIGIDAYTDEWSRLLALARYLEKEITTNDDFELLLPVHSIVVCFRWRGSVTARNEEKTWDRINQDIPYELRREGIAYVNQVRVKDQFGIRVCLSNFRTETKHLDELLDAICKIAER